MLTFHQSDYTRTLYTRYTSTSRMLSVILVMMQTSLSLCTNLLALMERKEGLSGIVGIVNKFYVNGCNNELVCLKCVNSELTLMSVYISPF